MSGLRLPWHREAHRLGGPDEIEIGLHPASLMGAVIGSQRLTNGLGINKGTLYLPDRDGPPLTAGEEITLSFSHFETINHFTWIGGRAHIINGLLDTNYDYIHPWESDPWGGGLGLPTSGSRTWNSFTTFETVTNDDGETATWTFPSSGTHVEQYSWDVTGVGHIGYLLHDFSVANETGSVSVSYSGSSTERVGAINFNRGSPVTVGDMVGEHTETTTSEVTITLTEDIPVGSGLLLVSATKADAGFFPTDAGTRPQVLIRNRLPSGNRAPKFRRGTQYYMLPEQPLTGSAFVTSPSPGGAAGGALDGTYPNPGIAASVAGAGLAETSDVLSVNVDNSTIEISSDTLRAKDEGITEAKLNHAIVAKGNSGSTMTLTVTDGSWQTFTLNANCTITVAGYTSSKGLSILVKCTQDGTGGRTITWDPDVAFIGDSQPSSTASSVTYFMLWADAGDSAIYGAKIGGTVSEAYISLSDVTTDNVTSSAHGFAPKSPADSTKFLNGAATPDYAQVKDSDLSTSDITTNNVSTSKHGFTPKLPNDATKYLDGTGAYTVPAGSGGSSSQRILLADGHANPFAFTDCLQMDDGSDFMWSDP
jgi:hypothetical protein